MRLPPYTKGAVEVFFESQPTCLRFNMPAYPCMVTENNIQYVTFGCETYDPRIGRKSFEPQQDQDNTYNRFWIESENEARIVVRFRGALCNRTDDVAHTDIPSGSPYGKGDWVDEWYYIYPDGTHTRYAKVYTGLTQQSKPFGFNRRPPNVIHEFMEAAADVVVTRVEYDRSTCKRFERAKEELRPMRQRDFLKVGLGAHSGGGVFMRTAGRGGCRTT